MSKIRTKSRPRYASAFEWPAWTDEVVFVPSEVDQAAMNDSWDFEGPAADDPIWDEWAGESIAQDQLERGQRMF